MMKSSPYLLLLAAAAFATVLLGSSSASALPASNRKYRCEEEAEERNGEEAEEMCTSFYRCTDSGRLEEADCPRGLFWSSSSSECEFPDNATCEVSDFRRLVPRGPRMVYLTFDDGPWIGTREVLQALEEEGVKATFFLNSDKMFDRDREDGRWKREEGQRMLVRLVEEGHVIADHSYGHMFHNENKGNVGVYLDVEEDARYFGVRNFAHVRDLMEEAGVSDRVQRRVSHTFFKYVRMPFTDNWRVDDKVRLDCMDCTLPGLSVLNGIKIADRLQEKFDVNIFGWDIQWATDWDNFNHEESCRHEYGAAGLLMRLMELPTKQKDKIVILTHDFMYYDRRPCGRWNLGQLRLFLKWAKRLGYEFRTVDTYAEDEVTPLYKKFARKFSSKEEATHY